MAGPRTRCLQERLDVLVTIWPDQTAKDLDGWALRYSVRATAVAHPSGRSLIYTASLDPRIVVIDALSTAPQTLSVVVPWVSQTLAPVDVDMRAAVGEVSALWTSGGETGAWVDRIPRIVGPARVTGWGTAKETISITVQDEELSDDGEFWPPGAEIDATAFPDVGSTDELARAPYSEGLLPPRVIAPIGSKLYAPIYVLTDRVDAVSGVSDLVAPSYGVGLRRPASTATPGITHQFRMLHPVREGLWMAGATSTDYLAAIGADVDALGRTYYRTFGEFTETVGVGASDFTAASADVTITSGVRGRIVEGDAIRDDGDGDDDYGVVESVDGNTYTLEAVYGGNTASNSSAVLLRQGKAVPYPGYRICSRGGEAGPDSVTPISNVIDALVYLLRDAAPSLPLALGDLEGMRSRFLAIDIATVINDRSVKPWQWALGGPLSWLPIRPYREGPRIRFAWVGPVDESDIETTLDLDQLGAAYRLRPYTWRTAEVFPRVQLRYAWDIERQNHRKTLLQDWETAKADPSPYSQRVTTGRAVRALLDWSSQSQGCTPPPLLVREVDEIEARLAAGIVTSWLLYDSASWRVGSVLEIGQPHFWMGPGTVFRATETGATQPAQVWRVEQRRVSPVGVGQLVAESVPA